MLIFGTFQLIMYKKYSNECPSVEKSHLYNFQMFLLAFVPLLTAVRFSLSALYYDSKTVYGFMVSSETFFCFSRSTRILLTMNST